MAKPPPIKGLSSLRSALEDARPGAIADMGQKASNKRSKAYLDFESQPKPADGLSTKDRASGRPAGAAPASVGAKAKTKPNKQAHSSSPTADGNEPWAFVVIQESPTEASDGRKKKQAALAAMPPPEPQDLRGRPAVDHVLSAIRDVRFSIAESRPQGVGADTQSVIEDRVALGAAVFRNRSEPDPDGYIVGVDFGTSSTKIAIHQPFAAGNPTAALPVPVELRSEGVEHLWQTAVWFSPERQSFSLFPRQGDALIEGFKAGLIQRQGGQVDSAGVPRCLAATAYLAMMFAYTIGFYDQNRPLGSVAAEQFAAFHLGVPVASKDDPLVRPEFLRVAAAAMALAPKADHLTLKDVERAYAEAAGVRRDVDLVGVRLYTELEGVIAGYLATPDRAPGAHMVVDVGASTLDVATFRLFDRDGQSCADVYATGVEMLGAQALGWSRVAEVPDSCFQAACAHHAWDQYHHTRTRRDRGFDRTLSDQPVTFLFVGGGRKTALHEGLFTNKSKDLYLGVPVRTPAPRHIAGIDPGADFARLLVAYGLSRDPSEVPVFRLPSEVEDEPDRPPRRADAFISKDQV
jgi:hypothetical protein